MNLSPLQAILSAAAAVLAGVAVAASGSVVLALASLAVTMCVAFVAQSQRLRDAERLVYRPVYVRRQNVQRRFGSDD